MKMGSQTIVKILSGLFLAGIVGLYAIKSPPKATAPLPGSEPVSATPLAESSVSNPKEQGDDTNGQHIGIITQIQSTAVGTMLTIDYAQLVDCTKDTAEECPNDYRITNANAQLRSFPLSPAAEVRLQTYGFDQNGALLFNQQVPLETFESLFGKTGGDYHPERLYYWITLRNGTVTGITEQYQP